MDRDGPGVQNALLLQVDLLQEVQHAAGVRGDAVVRPSPEVVLPDGAFRVALKAPQNKGSVQERKLQSLRAGF